MNIALIGYGKMGKTIEQIALERGHKIAAIINENNTADIYELAEKSIDVAIEFTGPEHAKTNLLAVLAQGIPAVSGTTGWLEDLPEVEKFCKEKKGSFLYASNFSIGVNLFFALNEKLAQLMAQHTQYKIALEEIHHTQKKDAPSGTAITLAEQILAENNHYSRWQNEATTSSHVLPIISKREDPAPGTHTINYHSSVDDIEIKHTAHNRNGFATGAVLAAEYIAGKKGIYTMKDVLDL